MTVVDVINELLQLYNLDIAGLAKKTGISIGPLYKMARGETSKISYQSAIKINRAFPEFSVEYLRSTDKQDNKTLSKRDMPSKNSMEELLAATVFEKLKPLLKFSQANQQTIIESNTSMLGILQHLVLDMDEMKDRMEQMEKQMEKITKLPN